MRQTRRGRSGRRSVYGSLPIRDTESEREIRLWRAVLDQAISDALYTGKDPDTLIAKSEAIAWFDLSNEDFITVCDEADLMPDQVKYIFDKAFQDPAWLKSLMETI